jgi:hypothetical protein
MAEDFVTIRLGITAGDLYTLWAPHWRDSEDEWEAILGKDDKVFAFESVADLVAFVRTNTDNDLSEHPNWAELGKTNAHVLKADEQYQVDLVAIDELLAENPTEDSVKAVANTLIVVSSIGSICELPAVTRFFNGNPTLGLVAGGMQNFKGRAGRKRWNQIAEAFHRSWDTVLTAIDEIVTTPSVDATESKRAAAELEEPYEAPKEAEAVADAPAEDTAREGDSVDDEVDPEIAAAQERTVLGGDEDFWTHVGIDPIRIMTAAGTLYTLRCYFDERPIFLGRNGRISVFPSERTLARYLADEHDHDLADLSTYDDIRTAATDGSLRVTVSEDNIYVLTGLADDIAEGAYALDRDQLELAVEFIRDVGDYSEDDTIDKLLAPSHALGRLINDVLDPEDATQSQPPSAAAVKGWEELEQFVESRLRRE